MRFGVLGKQAIVQNQYLLKKTYEKSREKDEQVIKTQKAMEEFFLAKGCLEHELIPIIISCYLFVEALIT